MLAGSGLRVADADIVFIERTAPDDVRGVAHELPGLRVHFLLDGENLDRIEGLPLPGRDLFLLGGRCLGGIGVAA